MDHDADEMEQRSRFLTVVLSVLGASVFLFFLFLTCGGLIVYVLAVVGGIGLIGLMHWLLWGQAFTAQADREAQEESRDQPAEPEGADLNGPPSRREWTDEERSPYRRF
jgi:hypothetical protein